MKRENNDVPWLAFPAAHRVVKNVDCNRKKRCWAIVTAISIQ